jgi:hypothetical protein
LNATFILKSLFQGGKDIASKTVTDLINNPLSVIENGLSFSQTALHVLEEVKKYPRKQGGWMLNTAGKTITVAGHVLKNIAKRN